MSNGAFYLSKHRLEALADGIFAVAMTLLVIELKIPESAHVHTEPELKHALIDLIAKFISWIISFFVLSIFWVSHHRLFHYVRHVDSKLTWLTLIYLGVASMMPFSSALSGEYGGSIVSQIIYSLNMALLGSMALLKSRYVHLHPELCNPPMPNSVFKGAQLRTTGLIAVAFGAVLITWMVPVSGAIGNMAFMLMAVFSSMGRRLQTRLAAEEAQQLSAEQTNSQPTA